MQLPETSFCPLPLCLGVEIQKKKKKPTAEWEPSIWIEMWWMERQDTDNSVWQICYNQW